MSRATACASTTQRVLDRDGRPMLRPGPCGHTDSNHYRELGTGKRGACLGPHCDCPEYVSPDAAPSPKTRETWPPVASLAQGPIHGP